MCDSPVTIDSLVLFPVLGCSYEIVTHDVPGTTKPLPAGLCCVSISFAIHTESTFPFIQDDPVLFRVLWAVKHVRIPAIEDVLYFINFLDPAYIFKLCLVFIHFTQEFSMYCWVSQTVYCSLFPVYCSEELNSILII